VSESSKDIKGIQPVR